MRITDFEKQEAIVNHEEVLRLCCIYAILMLQHSQIPACLACGVNRNQTRQEALHTFY